MLRLMFLSFRFRFIGHSSTFRKFIFSMHLVVVNFEESSFQSSTFNHLLHTWVQLSLTGTSHNRDLQSSWRICVRFSSHSSHSFCLLFVSPTLLALCFSVTVDKVRDPFKSNPFILCQKLSVLKRSVLAKRKGWNFHCSHLWNSTAWGSFSFPQKKL